jgi:ribosomal protein S18 acetylase RimI-like enzyme
MNALAPTLEFQIRETGPEDLEEILAHRRRMFFDMGYNEESALESMIRHSRPCIRKYLADGSYRGWFAVSPSGQVAAGAGMIITSLVSGPLRPEQTSRPYLLNVYTYPQFRKMGLARRLTEEAIEYCRKENFGILWLHASEYGRSLYESLGFVPTNEMKLML